MKLPDLEAWAIFAAVADARSFSGAADTVGISKATVSKAVSRLEARLGVSLFHRTSRRLALTDVGAGLAEHARGIVAQALAAEESARAGASIAAGRIRMAAPMSFGLSHVAPLVAGFLTAHPAVEIELHLSDARVDIVSEGFDVALRIGDLPDSSLRARRLCQIEAYLVAAPAYLAAAGTPTHPSHLSDHRLLGYTNITGPLRFKGRDGSEVAVRAAGPLSSNSGDALVPALVQGLGIARLPGFIVDAELARGTLVTILDEWAPGAVNLHLLTPPGALRPARVEALIAWLADGLRA